MFADKTVFIVGAGASCEVGMPSGSALATQISIGGQLGNAYASNPSGDGELRWALERAYSSAELKERLPAVRQIAAGIYMAETIDAYIDRHQKTPFVAEMGKFLIAYYLLRSESKSSLVVKSGTDGALSLPRFGETWLDPFARTLCAGHLKGDEGNVGKNITIVSFNYDRCIERYLQQAVATAFHIDAASADTIVRNMEILRPYGDLGRLPPSPTGYGEGLVPFGAESDGIDLRGVASRLKTFTEQVDDQRLLTRLRGAVGEASSIVFLGFGFHKQNIELLSTASRVHGLPQIYYSGLGIPEQSVQSILRDTVRMAGVAPIPVRVEQTTHFEIGKSAAHVMSVYRRALSA